MNKTEYQKFLDKTPGPWHDYDMRDGKDFIEFNPIDDLVKFYIHALDYTDGNDIKTTESVLDKFSSGRWYEFIKFCEKFKHKLNRNWQDIDDDEMIERSMEICGTREYPKLYIYIAWKYVHNDDTNDNYSLNDFISIFKENYTSTGRKYLTSRR